MLVIRIVYYCVVFLCIGISLFLTYFGFLRTFLGLTPYFTALIGLLLFAADYLIQRNRERGESWRPALLLFIIAATFSGVSNFNYLYANFMTKDVLTTTLRAEYTTFQDDLNATRASLGGIPAVRDEQNLRDRVETQLDQMWQQMNDVGRPGCGIRCDEHIRAINGLIDTTITDLARPGPAADDAELQQFFDTFRGLVLQAVDRRPAAQTYMQTATLQQYIAERLQFYDTAEAALAAGADLSLLASLSNESKEIERRANAILPADQAVEHTFIDPTLGRLGEIVYSLQNGFIDVPNLGATIIAAILSVFVDFIPVIFAFVAFRGGETATILTTRENDAFL